LFDFAFEAFLTCVYVTIVIALQAAINIGVTTSLLPNKGMPLPFISYGGSSMLAMGVTMGFALALTRRRPGAYEPGASLARPRRLLMP
jgi:cell division protein FtsW